jgi:hypothetical protein
MSPAGTWKKNQERSADQHSFTYNFSDVGVKSRIMDDKISLLNVDGPSILKVPCGAPGHREISGNFCERKL